MSSDMEFSMPTDWVAQIDQWTDQRGRAWGIALNELLKPRRKEGRVIDWTPERYYEMIYLWNEQGQTAAAITRWWVTRGLLPHKNDAKRGYNDGTGHRGVVDGMARRMQNAGILDVRSTYSAERVRNAVLGKKSPAAKPQSRPSRPSPSIAEIMEMRRQRVAASGGAFETLSRAERGMPPAELAQEQHPDYPVGVNHDAAYRIEHGRTSIFSHVDRSRLSVARRFSDIISDLTRVTNEPPALVEYETLKYREKDLIQLALRKLLPQVKALVEYLENLPPPEVPEAELRLIGLDEGELGELGG